MKPYLIGVGGQFASGKDVFCDYLSYKLNKNQDSLSGWRRASFASNVKRIYCETFDVPVEFVEEWKRKDECPPGFDLPVRRGLTFIGDGFRDIKSNIWIDLLLRNNHHNLIISDVRYINECTAIRENNGIAVLLWRPGHENDYQSRSEQELMPFVRALRDSPDGPVSMAGAPFDLWIKNDGDLGRLYAKIDNIVVPFVTKFREDYVDS